MRLLALSGRRNAALSQYAACRRLLDEDLGVAPADQTTALYRQIRQGLLSDVGATPPPLPPDTPVSFVAREQQLATLDRLLGRALGGQGRVAFVTGGPGSGKTMLLDAFVRRAMAAHAELIAVGGTCSAYAGIGDPFLPFCEILRMLTGEIEARRASGAITAEHARRLWAAFPDVLQTLATEGPDLVGRLLPGDALALRAEAFGVGDTDWRTRLDELAKRHKTRADPAAWTQADLFRQVTDILHALARRHPLLLVLDDLQWADAGTASLLFHLARRLTGRRILIIGAYRPGDVASGQNGGRHPLQPIVNELQRDFGDVQLDLDQADGRRFVEAYVDSEPNRLGTAFRETLTQHTNGNPLFTVELLRGLQERGDLVRDLSRRWVAESNLDWGQLPARVEGVIAELIGRLSPACRETVTVASVEGEAFTAEVLAQVQGVDESQIIRRLSGPLGKQYRLVAADRVRWVDGRRLSRYRFRHALFQGYLYGSLDEVERARLHEAVGTALETLYGQRVVEISGSLAHHFEAARVIPKAADYLLQAGKDAVRLSANEEAIALFTRGLDLLDTLPRTGERDRQEFALRLALYAPLTSTQGYASTELARSNARLHKLSLRLGEERDLVPALISLAGLHSFRAEFSTAIELAERANAPGRVVWAAHVLGMTALYQGDLLAARRHLERTLEVDTAHHQAMVTVRGRDPRVVYRSFAAWEMWLLGYPDQAHQLGEDALRLARQIDHPPSVAMALLVGNIIPLLLGREYEALPGLIEAFAEVAAGRRLELSGGGVRLARGRAMVHQGQAQAGIKEMQEGLREWQATGTQAWASVYLGLLADACLKTGHMEEARSALHTAFEAVQRSGERIVEAELYRLQGKMMLHLHHEEGVEAAFRQATRVARRQRARSWELRAAMDLSRMLQQWGKQKEAYGILQEVYGRFTEGFNTPDLQEARLLLDRLSGG
jgi:predicted ATPase